MKVRGYHGTSLDIAQQIAANRLPFKPSVNNDDWLGGGIYFFQDGLSRARTWAVNRYRDGAEIPAVLAVDIDLTHCIDLFDSSACFALSRAYQAFEIHAANLLADPVQAGLCVENGDVFTTACREVDPRKRKPIQNFRDRAMVDWYVDRLLKNGQPVNSVRGMFLSGKAVFPESHLFNWAHAQIAVVNPVVLGRAEIVFRGDES